MQTSTVPAGLDDAAAPRKVALVVGLNRYAPDAGLHDLKYAAADAEAVGNTLSDAGYRVHEVLDTATRQGFLDALTEATADLQRQDLFVLYFAGHAQLDPAARGKQLSLLFSDDEGVEGDGLEVDALALRIGALPAKQRVVMLDTCYSERTQQMLALNRGSAPVVTTPVVGQFDAWIFSAAPQQSAQEDPELGHGVFTWFLLQALAGEADANGDGSVGVLEIYNWVGFKTAERTGRAQVPWIEESRIGWDDLALVQVASKGLSVAVPWYERVLPGAVVLLNGLSRGPGPVEAGRHQLEVRSSSGEVLVRRRISAKEGEVLSVDDWLHASRSTVRLGAGVGYTAARDRVAPVTGTLSGWWSPRSAGRIRPVVGAAGGFGQTSLNPTVKANQYSGTARGGAVWAATANLSMGPWVGAGGYWSQEAGGTATTALVEGGGLFQADIGPVWVALEAGARAYPIEGRFQAHPAGALLFGATLR